MLEYRAARSGRTFLKAGRCGPTGRVCSACGAQDGPGPLHVRVWTCRACGAVLDREVNAAVDVARAAGPAVPARGAQAGRAFRPGAARRGGNPPDTAATGDADVKGCAAVPPGARRSPPRTAGSRPPYRRRTPGGRR
ncbi:zinc ribbon domain-containing protein [Streptomyces sp. HK10]|uniref:zinc ribbon domain-containing protein n=1 Tax=Streptomyces sp. HK10 TaxID=3373255 RepID=UPI00374A8EA8